jgi:hypothetical protein
MAAAVAVLPAALAGGPVAAHGGSATAMLATAALVLAGTVAPATLFAFGQSRVTADVAGAFLNLEPLFGAAIGVVLFGNPLGPVQLAGGAGIVTGIGLSTYQVVRDERTRRPALTAEPEPSTPSSPRAAAAQALVRAGQAEAGPRPVVVTRRPAIAPLAVAAGDGALQSSRSRPAA